MVEIIRHEGETEDALICRVCAIKDVIGTWQDVADTLNKILGHDYNESTYRKRYQYFMDLLTANEDKYATSDNQLDEMRQERQLLYKAQCSTRDERRELRNILRDEARKEDFRELIKREIRDNTSPIEWNFEKVDIKSDNDLIVHLTDLHTGINIKTWYNEFNDEVLEERLQKYLNKILDIRERHNSENCYIIIGEILSGLIHDTLRIQNNEDVISQFKVASTLISYFIAELSKNFNEVHVYVTSGNHSRVIAKKDVSLKGENFDNLLPYYLEAKLAHLYNVEIHENVFDEGIALFNVRGVKCASAHGDKDSPINVVQKFTMLFGYKPDVILLGHRHLNGLTTVYDTKIIESGCVSGSGDDYTSDLRLKNRAEQTVSVITKDGLEALYDVQVD